MRLAVVIDNYNYARYLGDCLDSVFAQTRPADEIVVVDDGSTDDSLERLEAIARCAAVPLRVVAKANGGQLSAFRAGLAATDCEVLCLLDSDDAFEPGHLAAVERAFRDDPDTAVIYAAHAKVFADGRRQPARQAGAPMPSQRLETIYLLRYCGGPTSTIAIRRDALERVLPGADASAWRVSADAVIVLRVAALGLRRRTLATPTVVYRIHGNNLFHGRRLRGEKKARLRAALAALVRDERVALDATGDAARVALYREELTGASRTPTSMYRFARLAAQLPAATRARLVLWRSYAGWLLRGGTAER